MKTRAKRPARKSRSKLQGVVELARERWQAAKKSAKRAKQAAKQARRQFKDAKKVVKRAKAEMLAAASKLQELGHERSPQKEGARQDGHQGRITEAGHQGRTAQAGQSSCNGQAAARKKPAPAEVVSTVAIEQATPVQQEDSGDLARDDRTIAHLADTQAVS